MPFHFNSLPCFAPHCHSFSTPLLAIPSHCHTTQFPCGAAPFRAIANHIKAARSVSVLRSSISVQFTALPLLLIALPFLYSSPLRRRCSVRLHSMPFLCKALRFVALLFHSLSLLSNSFSKPLTSVHRFAVHRFALLRSSELHSANPLRFTSH